MEVCLDLYGKCPTKMVLWLTYPRYTHTHTRTLVPCFVKETHILIIHLILKEKLLYIVSVSLCSTFPSFSYLMRWAHCTALGQTCWPSGTSNALPCMWRLQWSPSLVLGASHHLVLSVSMVRMSPCS